jgi:hypothetical protein
LFGLAGQAKTARIVASDGSEVFSCDVGDEKSDAAVRINSFRLAMP